MKNVYMIVMISMVTIGCAARETPVQAPCTTTHVYIQDNETAAKVQGKMVEGSTWVWNESKQAWEWLNSEENKERARKAWAATKQAASEAYDKAVKAYQDQR